MVRCWVDGVPDALDAVVVAARLHEGAIGEELAGAAPGVGLDEERADGVVGGVEHERVRGAVVLGAQVALVVAADAVGKADERRPDVGPVQEQHLPRVRHRRVHARDPHVLVQHRPRRLLPCAPLRHHRQHHHHHDHHSHPPRHCSHHPSSSTCISQPHLSSRAPHLLVRISLSAMLCPNSCTSP